MADEESSSTSGSMGIGLRLCVAGIRQKFPAVQNITTQHLSSLLHKSKPSDDPVHTMEEGEKLLILDTRPDEEYQVSHIEGAVRVDFKAPIEDIITAVPQLQLTDSPMTVVCYCSVGYRSSVVAEKLQHFYKTKDDGRSQVKCFNLEGSLFKWTNEGRPLVDSNGQPTKYTHPYNTLYGKMLNSELRKSSI